MTHNLLLYRFALFNLIAAALMGALSLRGVVLPLFEQDTTFISHGIVALFAVAWLATARQIVRVSRKINLFKRRPVAAKARDKDKALAKGGERATGLRSYFTPVLTDPKAALTHYVQTRPDELKAALLRLAEQDVREGKRSIPGFEITEEKRVV